MRAILFTLLAVVALLPTASAWTMSPGVRIEAPDAALTIDSTTDITGTLTFHEDGSPILDGMLFRFAPDAPSWEWALVVFDAGSAVVLHADNLGAAGNITITGLTGTWLVTGVTETPFKVNSTHATAWPLEPGEQTITMYRTLADEVEIITAFDPYVDIVLWGGIMILCLMYTAWFPAIASLVALGNSILPSPLWGTPASVMLVAIALVLHVVLERGIVPAPWGKR